MKYGSFLIALLLLTAAPVSADTIYRWTDDNGVTQFTAHPPRDRESTRVNTRSGSLSAPVGTSRQSTPTPADPEPAQAQAQTQTQAQPEYPANEEPCQVARQNLTTLEAGGRIRVDGADGPRFMGEEERLERLEETRAFIADSC